MHLMFTHPFDVYSLRFFQELFLFKISALWDIAPCSLFEVDQISEVHTAFIMRPVNAGGSMHL
jgi:hypothetical protein